MQSAHRWREPPGNFDVLHLRRRQYPGNHPLEFPDLLPCDWIPPAQTPLLAYTRRDDQGTRRATAIGHFFLDDYRFESLWTRPTASLSRVHQFRAVLTPDFSLYRDWPPIAQMWNHYRSLWLGRYWQEHGARVIPTVNWSMPNSYAWCFAGIPRQQTVALAIPDLHESLTQRLFAAGFAAMVEALEPPEVLVYGRWPADLPSPVPLRCFDPDWNALNRRLSPPKTPGHSNRGRRPARVHPHPPPG